MNSLGKREKILLVILGIVLFFYLYYLLFLNPYLKKIDEAKERVNQCTIEVEKIKAAKENIKNQMAEIEELKVTLEKCLDAIPEVERNPEIAYNLKKIGDNNKINISTVGLGEPTELKAEENTNSNQTTVQGTKKIYIVPATMSVSGDYNSIMNFIYSIENDKRITEVKGVGINSDSQNGGLNLNLTMNYYYTDRITDKTLDYEFNAGSYGKVNPFK